ncbi:hypothetical protein [Streptomyces luteireticuli]|uniref:hypothetical protein n=1 Tax=Streptomyces luteireticuli TaxID=173858 RepID=UPI0035570BDF
MNRRKSLAIVTAAVALGGGLAFGAPGAQAGQQDTPGPSDVSIRQSADIGSWRYQRCGDENWFCLYYSPNANGAGWGYTHADANVHDLLNYRFNNSGAGAGQVVGNNAASAENASWCNVGIWYHANFTGDSNWLAPYQGGNLTSWMRNNERSIRVKDDTRCPGKGDG